MADLTPRQMDDVAFFLGYPSKILVENSTSYNPIFKDFMQNLSDVTVERVGDLLSLIRAARKNLDESQKNAHTTGIDELSFDASLAVTNIQKQYKRYIKELANLLDYPVRSAPGASSVGSTRIRS